MLFSLYRFGLPMYSRPETRFHYVCVNPKNLRPQVLHQTMWFIYPTRSAVGNATAVISRRTFPFASLSIGSKSREPKLVNLKPVNSTVYLNDKNQDAPCWENDKSNVVNWKTERTIFHSEFRRQRIYSNHQKKENNRNQVTNQRFNRFSRWRKLIILYYWRYHRKLVYTIKY